MIVIIISFIIGGLFGMMLMACLVASKEVDNMSKIWWKYAGIRALKTFCQTAIATIGTSATMGDVNWIIVGSTSLLSAILSLLTSIAGIPEVEMSENNE